MAARFQFLEQIGLRYGDLGVDEISDRKAELSCDICIGAGPYLRFLRVRRPARGRMCVAGRTLAIHGDDDGDFAHLFAFRVFRGRAPTLSRRQTI